MTNIDIENNVDQTLSISEDSYKNSLKIYYRNILFIVIFLSGIVILSLSLFDMENIIYEILYSIFYIIFCISEYITCCVIFLLLIMLFNSRNLSPLF